MVNVQPLDNVGAIYNAVNVHISEPKTTIPAGFRASEDDKGIYNAINMDIDKPSVEIKKDNTYEYPQAETFVSSDMAGFKPVVVPQLPPPTFAYSLINNGTYVDAPIDMKVKDFNQSSQKDLKSVPAPNVTTTEAEKKDFEPSFHGLQNIADIDVNDDQGEVSKQSFKGEPETEESKELAFKGEPEMEEPKELAFKGEPETEEAKELAFKGEPETEEAKELAFKGEPEMEEPKELAFKGEPEDNTTEQNNSSVINFKATDGVEKKNIEIVPPQDIKPDVDVNSVVLNLCSEDLDVQAKQIADIVNTFNGTSDSLEPYILTDVFTGLIDVINKDVSELESPTQEQIETRKKVIINEIYRAQAEDAGIKSEDIKLPYSMSDAELSFAIKLSPMEQAERNKSYALVATALLAKVYADETEKRSGNVIPLTDLPGVSAMVDSIRYNQNSETKLAAIDALVYIAKPEYKEELASILILAMKDENPVVARNAAVALENLE
jgi:hypothetical protein